VIKDEAVWSSSLRGEVAASPAMPDLLINLSRNDLGDEAAEAICDALYNDKWLLGTFSSVRRWDFLSSMCS
jgi:hypothetical protein